jgi:predicted signal transduction protein with EAL and GGDEF domain
MTDRSERVFRKDNRRVSWPQVADVRRLQLNDPASGLPTGPLLGEAIERRIVQWSEGDPPIVWIGAEIQRLGDITSAFGPRTRTTLLREIAERLRDMCPEAGTPFHVHSDIFGILLDGAHYEQAINVARRLVQLFERPFMVNDLPVTVQAFAGLADYPNHASDADELRQAAAEALREARDDRRPYAIYSPARHKEQRANIALLGELKAAIPAGQLELFYQPVVDLKNDVCVTMEALVRWRHPTHGLIPPGRFIPAAERTLLIGEITAWTTRAAIEQIRRWRREGIGIRVSVNLSGQDIGRPDIAATIADLLNYYGVEGSALAFEITESTLVRAPERALESLAALRGLGASIAIDDFGQGYSSLTYLARLPATTLKIDQSFALNMEREPKNETIIRAAVALAHDLGMRTVLEGVETEALYRRAKELSSDRAQGYYIARPMPAADVPAWLQNSRFGKTGDA